jgi:DNA-binding NarL/FixJ family response regulator
MAASCRLNSGEIHIDLTVLWSPLWLERRVTVRTVLVCVRTPLAAQAVLGCATRLGVSGAVRTAVTVSEALARLAEQSADLILVDTALSRPDSVEFTRRILAAAPGATVVLFGVEEPRIAAAAVAAGARGVIRADIADPVTVVAKALLLVLSPAGEPATLRAGTGPKNGTTVPGPAGPAGPLAAPVGSLAARSLRGATTPAGAPGAPSVPQQRSDPASPEAPRRRVELTERELQVLRGMSDGKSNAEIGRELFVSEDTVKTHARRLFRKLGARDRAHAVASAFRAGLVS